MMFAKNGIFLKRYLLRGAVPVSGSDLQGQPCRRERWLWTKPSTRPFRSARHDRVNFYFAEKILRRIASNTINSYRNRKKSC